jgi:hypothetical protein
MLELEMSLQRELLKGVQRNTLELIDQISLDLKSSSPSPSQVSSHVADSIGYDQPKVNLDPVGMFKDVRIRVSLPFDSFTVERIFVKA